MKNQVKGFVTGFIAAVVLMAGVVSFADTELKTIQIDDNPINVTVNGSSASVPNFIYDGRTYMQVRSLSEILGKNVSWDANTRTASITDNTSNASKTSDTSGTSVPQASEINSVSAKQLTTQEIAQKGNAVVLLQIYDDFGDLTAMGSGFIVSSDGKIVTNYHVIKGASSIEAVTIDGQTYTADVINYDSARDIAILKLEDAGGMPTVALGDSSTIQLGESVVAIGNPEGLQNVVSQGIISTKSRTINGQDFIQITAPISPGSSGGALFDSSGEVIGITAAYLSDGQAINFAIPINYVKPLLSTSGNS